MNDINWDDIEERIRPHVKALRDAGYETTGSCGHDMWITVTLEPERAADIHKTLLRLGYTDFEVTICAYRGLFHPNTVRVTFKGELAGDGKPFDLILLKVEPDTHPLYFVVHARRFPHHSKDDGEQEHRDAYFYNEHTCPTNWTDDILAVISDGDPDPHGFATFVRRLPAPNDMDENGYNNAASWLELFPETVPQDIAADIQAQKKPALPEGRAG